MNDHLVRQNGIFAKLVDLDLFYEGTLAEGVLYSIISLICLIVV